MRKVVIIDYGMGNLDSVARAVEECGGTPIVTGEAREFKEASHIILPGVGSFAEGMRNIVKSGLNTVLTEEVVNKKTPLLGICLGMQLLATKGVEGGRIDGLNLIPGEAVRFKPDTNNIKVPHIGWNEVIVTRPSPLFGSIGSGKDFYFVHSYHFVPKNDEDAIGRTPYCGNFVSAVWRKNIFGVQFHPEKSLRLGLELIKNFLFVRDCV